VGHESVVVAYDRVARDDAPCLAGVHPRAHLWADLPLFLPTRVAGERELPGDDLADRSSASTARADGVHAEAAARL